MAHFSLQIVVDVFGLPHPTNQAKVMDEAPVDEQTRLVAALNGILGD